MLGDGLLTYTVSTVIRGERRVFPLKSIELDMLVATLCEDEKVLKFLSNSENVEVKAALAGNAALDADSVYCLAFDPDFDVAFRALGHPKQNEVALDNLSADEDWRLRYQIARNRNTSHDTIQLLLVDENERVRMAAVMNPVLTECDIEIIQEMAEKDESKMVREAAQKRLSEMGGEEKK